MRNMSKKTWKLRVWNHMTEMQKLMGKKKFEEVLGDLIYKPAGKPTLVPVTDKRPAMDISDAKDEFNEIKEI